MPAIQLRPRLGGALPAIFIVLAQSLACLFFVVDALADESGTQGGGRWANLLEVGIALALMAGVAFGAIYLFHLRREVRTRAAVIAVAKGAMSRIIADRFIGWHLSAAEADVALFALKGCSAQEIAGMRSSAASTVRAQLSQVYAKAGVSSQSMLMSLFLDDLMEDVSLDEL